MKITTTPGTAAPMMLSLKTSTDQQVRRKFLNALGIEPVWSSEQTTASTLAQHHPSSCTFSVSSTSDDNTAAASSCNRVSPLSSSSGSSSSSSSTAPEGGTTASSHHGFDSKEWMHPRTQNVVVSQEPLKYSRHADAMNTPPKRRKVADNDPDDGLTTTATKKPPKRCAFNETVQVVPIPMRSEYSNRVRSRLWSNAAEIQENATRNTMEYASEGWDWRSVTLDEGMYICSTTGERIHPVHYYEPNPNDTNYYADDNNNESSP